MAPACLHICIVLVLQTLATHCEQGEENADFRRWLANYCS